MNRICKFDGCEKKVYCRGFCANHYMRDYILKKRETDGDFCKSIKRMHKMRFGGLRDRVLRRDNYACQICGMTDFEHRLEWDCGITVDHIDNQGRYSNIKNHSIDNMWTLCLRCHGRKDQKKARSFYELPISSREKILSNLKYRRKVG